MIPFLSLKPSYLELRGEVDAAVAQVLTSGWYIGGPELSAFEKDWAAYCGARHAVGVGNGLEALELVLRALDIGEGDEVITASNGFIATLLAISATGARPVLVEPSETTHTLDPERVEAAVTPRTRALLPTHLYGHPADLDPLMEIAQRRGLLLIEDAAQAHGARYKGQRIGRHGDAVCWSFYPSKNLGALGDGGAVTCNDATLAARIRQLGNYGSTQRYIHDLRGKNSRLDPLQAAVLRVKLAHLEAWNDRRRGIAKIYGEGLSGVGGLGLPEVAPWADPVWHLYVVRSPKRDELAKALASKNVETLVHYPVPPHLQGAYRHLPYPPGTLCVAEKLAHEVLSLPMGPHLSSDDAHRVVDAVRQCA